MKLELFDSPLEEREHPSGFGGVQKMYRFPNGYGASVVRFAMPFGSGYGSYTSDETEWELAVVKFNSETGADGFELDYGTGITDKVMGHLDAAHVEQVLQDIKRLPTKN